MTTTRLPRGAMTPDQTDALFAAALGALRIEHAHQLAVMFDGEHAVFITNLAARTFFGIDQGFAVAPPMLPARAAPEAETEAETETTASVADVQAIVIPREQCLTIANAVNPAVGLQVAAIDPAMREVIPMFALLMEGEGDRQHPACYVKPGMLLTPETAPTGATPPKQPDTLPAPPDREGNTPTADPNVETLTIKSL